MAVPTAPLPSHTWELKRRRKVYGTASGMPCKLLVSSTASLRGKVRLFGQKVTEYISPRASEVGSSYMTFSVCL